MSIKGEGSPGGQGHVVEAVEEHREVLVMVLVLGHLEPQLRHHQPKEYQH